MTTMKTKLYTVLTAALLSTTVLSTAQGASADAGEGEGASARNILSLLASGEARTVLAAVVRSKMVLTNDNFVEKIAGMFSDTEVLDLSKVTMGPDQIAILLEKLSLVQCTEDVDSTVLSDNHFAAFSKVFDTMNVSKLHTIIFGTVSSRDALSILRGVQHMPSLKKIEFATPLVIDGAGLEDISRLRPDLMFGFTYQGPLLPLLEQVRKRPFPQLTNLNLGVNSIGDDGARDLAAVLPCMTQLTTLDLGRNSIASKGVRALADALPHMTQLTSLHLEGNRIGVDGARALAVALPHMTQLKTLILRGNGIGVDGARALAAALRHLPELTTLNFMCNPIDSEGATALADALPHMTKLKTLLFWRRIV